MPRNQQQMSSRALAIATADVFRHVERPETRPAA
jgi:hypothetical protein